MKVSDSTRLNAVSITGLRRQLGLSFKTKTTLILQGDPGTGKTEICSQILSGLVGPENKVWYYNAAVKSEEFVGGYMWGVPGEKVCQLVLPEHWGLVQAGDAVIIDEVDKVDQRKQNMYLELTQFKEIDGVPIGPDKNGKSDVSFVVLSNDASHRAGSHGLSPLLGNRAKVLWFRPHADEVLEHFSSVGMHHMLLSYLREHPNNINRGYAPTELRNCTSRSWKLASTEMLAWGEHLTQEDFRVTLAGFVPDSIVAEVDVYFEMSRYLVPLKDIIEAKDPSRAPLPKAKEASKQNALRYMQLFMVVSWVASHTSAKERSKAVMILWNYSRQFPAECRAAIIPFLTSGSLAPGLFTNSNESGVMEIMQFIEERKKILGE